VPIVLKSGSLKLLEASEPVQACNGNALPLPLPFTALNNVYILYIYIHSELVITHLLYFRFYRLHLN
jgi:hypothetical protein